ncbi:MAG TPA: hypothetical protein VKY27_05725 [Bacteriovoracaceae bacterium]|nr:hypothetical protein [Bacteriovoracaceae bacterium]
MSAFFIIFISFFSYGFPQELFSVYEKLEVHEFYKDNELIKRPVDAWQNIASFSISNTDLSLSRLCLKYRPSSEAKGIFRIELMPLKRKCQENGKIIYEQDSLLGIQFQREPEFKITFSHKDFSTTSWTIKTIKKKASLELLDTPDKFWGEKVLFLNDHTDFQKLLTDGTQCLKVSDDCKVEGSSSCQQCENGSLEAPNGCLVGPRYCSSAECGTKGNPACRRGVKFQNKRSLDCRVDMSFAFCKGDSVPSCQGLEVWCL